MKVLIVGILVLALAVAGVSTYLIQTFSGEENIGELQKEAQKPQIRVLVASRDIQPGEALVADAISWQVWVDEALNPQFIAVESDDQEAQRAKDFIGGVVRKAIAEGEPILASKVLKRDEPGLMAGVLKKGMRAVTFAVAPTSASGGFILPGDRVDVLLTHNKVKQALQKKQAGVAKDPDAPLTVLSETTETIMRDLLVLAVNTLIGEPPKGGIAVAAKNITLELTPKQAELLITARTMGKISMVLRSIQSDKKQGEEGKDSEEISYTNDVEVSPFIRNIDAILKAQEEAGQPAPKPAAAGAPTAAPAPRPKPEPQVIKIYRGGGAPQEVESK